jgi:hypothetical protein
LDLISGFLEKAERAALLNPVGRNIALHQVRHAACAIGS